MASILCRREEVLAMMCEISEQLPSRLLQALDTQRQLNALGIYFIPIRHHSPACAYATLQALQQLNPAHILLEAPQSFNAIVQDLQHPAHRPPLAVLCQTQVTGYMAEIQHDNHHQADEHQHQQEKVQFRRSAYYPFCDYSPEWVALQFKAQQDDAPTVECIDLDWSKQVLHESQVHQQQDWQARTLQQERYLAHNAYIQRLADKLHCRNHDEVWDTLFELQPRSALQDWANFFYQVLMWCAMARLDYEPSVLDAESSLIREQQMFDSIIQRYAHKTGDMVVVTGGFHTLALIEQVGEYLLNEQASKKKKSKSKAQQKQQNSAHLQEKHQENEQQQHRTTLEKISVSGDETWLIRYSFDRLDALNGYASGMPSPAFYQQCWQQLCREDVPLTEQRLHSVVRFLSEFSQQLRQQHIGQSSFIHSRNATEHAIRLAELRQHHLIARYDMIDACISNFIKGSVDDGQHDFHQLLYQQLSGADLGDLAEQTRIPPVVAQVYQLVKQARFNVNETTTKQSKLDVLRKKSHRQRSQLLHLLAFLDVGFARRLSGADFLHGGQLHLLFETWQYAWTPAVEARLIELAELGSDIYGIATEKILAKKQSFIEQGQGQSSALAVQLLIQSAMMGLDEQMQTLFAEVRDFLPHDPDLSSVLACGQHLIYLWTGRKFLQFAEEQQLFALLQEVIPTALFLLSQLQQPSEQQSIDLQQQLLDLHRLIKQMLPILAHAPSDDSSNNTSSNTSNNTATEHHLLDAFYQTVQRLRPDWQELPSIIGIIDALGFVDNQLNEQQLGEQLANYFAVGASAEYSVAYLSGLMNAVPSLFLRYQGLTQRFNQFIEQCEDEQFIAILPDLRLAFTRLKPMETAQFAEQIAQMTGVHQQFLATHQHHIGESEMLAGVQLNQQLHELLQQQGTLSWLQE